MPFTLFFLLIALKINGLNPDKIFELVYNNLLVNPTNGDECNIKDSENNKSVDS